MATANVTGTPATQGFPHALACAFKQPELEKISCSLRGQETVHPIQLIGKRVRLAELILSEIGLFEGDAYNSTFAEVTVLSVNLGSVQHGIETSLLLDDGVCTPYYAEISSLTILEVLQ